MMPRFPAPLSLLLTEAAVSPEVQQAFVWSNNLGKVATVVLFSLIPSFEGRYSILTGLAMGMPLVLTFVLGFVISTVPMPFVFWFFKPVLKWFYSLPFKPVQRFAAWLENRVQKKSKGMETGSLLTLFVFVAVPFTGAGVWTGAMLATLLDIDRKRASVAIALGNLVACIIATLVYAGGDAIVRSL